MRQAKPWFRSQTDSWYVELGGTQHNLGKHPDGAPPPKRGKGGWNAPPPIVQAFHKLMAEGPQTPKGQVLVCQVCDLFLQFAEKHNDERTFKWYKAYLQDFCSQYGKLPSAELKPFHVTRWLDAHPGWKTGRRAAITALKRSFNWATNEGLIPVSPIRGVKKPPVPSRARLMTKGERSELLAAIPDKEFRLFVEAMQESGCRPSEVARVTAQDVNLDLGVWVLHRHKTVGKVGKPRIVYLTPRLAEITRELMLKHPEGALFRGPRFKKPFGMHGVCARFQRLRKKLPHLKDAIAYAYRHSFASEALENGVGIVQVAELLGHRSTDMVMRHYQHISQNVGHMREAARKATSG